MLEALNMVQSGFPVPPLHVRCAPLLEENAPELLALKESTPSWPVMLRISSLPHAPASAPCPSAQFRKGAALFDNHIVFNPFRLSLRPFRNWVLGVSESAGTYNAPGLPELTGEYASQEGCNAVFTAKELSGVFTKGTQRSGPVPGYTSGSYAAWKLKFLASGANGLYGASATVMPPSIDMPVIFYLGRRGK